MILRHLHERLGLSQGRGFDGFPVGWGPSAPAGSAKATNLSSATIAGIAIGSLVALCVLVGVIWSVARYGRKRRGSLGGTTLVGDPEETRHKELERSRSSIAPTQSGDGDNVKDGQWSGCQVDPVQHRQPIILHDLKHTTTAHTDDLDPSRPDSPNLAVLQVQAGPR